MKYLLYILSIAVIYSSSNYCVQSYDKPVNFLYAPWRDSYENKPNNNEIISKVCPLCKNINSNEDKKDFILSRYKNFIIQLNLFPYNKGHILILPLSHKKDLHEFSVEEKFELMELISQSSKILQETFKAEGINIGINIGKPAGASIPDHLHVHLLPRWQGDDGFIFLIGQTRVIGADLNKIYEILKPKFDEIKI